MSRTIAEQLEDRWVDVPRLTDADRPLRIVGRVRQKQQSVFIDCEETPSCGRWVLHEFHSEKRIARVGKADMYVCTQCGHMRRFGLR
jgi:hypothetical protein